MEFEAMNDSIVSYFTGPKYLPELQEAKKEFFEKAGIIDEESQSFEPRMAQFLDWYIFSRDLSEYNVPPIQLATQRDIVELPNYDATAIENMSQAIHSLFEFIKVKGSDVYIRDLFSKKKIVLRNSDVSIGFNPDEIFDTRVIPLEDNFVFAKGFCFHPPGAKKFIQKEIKKVRHLESSHHEALMFRLVKMRYKLEQYKHIKMEFIYTNDQSLKI